MNRGKQWPLVLLLGIACLATRPGSACTAAFLNQTAVRIMAANMDWPTGDGMVVVNKRGFFKSAVTDPGQPLKPAQWTSRYGSVTFNHYAIDWPWGGMNEAGLAGTAQIMRWTRYPPEDHRPSIFLLQWLQYQFDNFGSVQEVLDHLPAIRIRPVSSKKGAHFFFCDQQGDAAVIAFIDGRSVVYHGDDLPVEALANDPYAGALVYLGKFQGFGGRYPVPESNLSKDRFVRAARGVATFASVNPKADIDAAFGLLDRLAYRASRHTFTQWQVVFDLSNRRISYRTRNHPHRREVDMARFDFSCADPIRVADIDGAPAGTGVAFRDYSHGRHRRYVEPFFKPHPLKRKETEARVDRISRYPDSFTCH